jgi:hypothetical protein
MIFACVYHTNTGEKPGSSKKLHFSENIFFWGRVAREAGREVFLARLAEKCAETGGRVRALGSRG